MFEAIIQFPFLQRALIAAVLVGLMCSIMGVFVVYGKMSFFSDAIAHSALAGIALGLVIGVSPFWSAMLFGVIVAVMSVYLKNNAKLNIDTVLGLFLPFSMALGILILGFRESFTPDLISFLFGSILSVSTNDLIIVFVVMCFSLLWIYFNYRNVLFMVFDRDLALSSGVNVDKIEYYFMILMSLVVVSSLQVVGIVLVGGLIVIPAAAAKNVAKSFGQMIWVSGLFGVLSGVLGLVLSYYLDVASGSSIVIVAMGIFVISFLFRRK